MSPRARCAFCPTHVDGVQGTGEVDVHPVPGDDLANGCTASPIDKDSGRCERIGV